MDPSLGKLAAAFGVAVEYEDWQRRRVEVPERTVRRVLAGLGVDVDRPDDALREADEREWRRLIPPTVVAVEGAGAVVAVRAPDVGTVTAELTLENGERRPLTLDAKEAGVDSDDGDLETETATHSDVVPDSAGVTASEVAGGSGSRGRSPSCAPHPVAPG
jgi:4-alpha-glucanotransferase